MTVLHEFADRHPTLSAVIVAALFTVVPGALMFLMKALSGSGGNAGTILFLYALALELFLCLKMEHPILFMLPFAIVLIGFIVCEVVYTVSESMNPPGVGPSALVFLLSSAVVTLFGAEAAGIVGGLLAWPVISLLRKIWDAIVYR